MTPEEVVEEDLAFSKKHGCRLKLSSIKSVTEPATTTNTTTPASSTTRINSGGKATKPMINAPKKELQCIKRFSLKDRMKRKLFLNIESMKVQKEYTNGVASSVDRSHDHLENDEEYSHAEYEYERENDAWEVYLDPREQAQKPISRQEYLAIIDSMPKNLSPAHNEDCVFYN